MNVSSKHTAFAFTLCLTVTIVAVPLQAGVEGLKGECRNGQVFLQWCEAGLPSNSTRNVYTSDQPISPENMGKARKIGFAIEPHSARDWTQNPASFENGEPAAPVGFRIRNGGERLDPNMGLFVHTVTPEDAGTGYYAVTVADSGGTGVLGEAATLVPGQNTLAQPVSQRLAALEPIWNGAGTPLPVPPGLPLILNLHSRLGGKRLNYYDYMLFGDAAQGWREGLPHVFKVVVDQDAVTISPSDRVWTPKGRAFHSFWYGYHSRIYDPAAMKEGGVVVNYGERRLLWLVDWAQRELKTDPDRVYLTGTSMGGCGSVSMALHHPDRIAAIYASVPILSYTPPATGYTLGTDWRITNLCGSLAGRAPTSDGMTVLDRMNGIAAVSRAGDLPFMYIVNGRQDGSIPWYNNPPFYRAMNLARQGLAAYWDNGGHGDAGSGAPADVKAWREAKSLLRFTRKQSFPAFSNVSVNRNPGNGQKEDGDIVGWINRGMDWENVVDEPGRYAISIAARYPELAYPVSVDMTPRRVQRFAPKAGASFVVSVSGKVAGKGVVDDKGGVTVKGILIPDAQWVRVEITP